MPTIKYIGHLNISNRECYIVFIQREEDIEASKEGYIQGSIGLDRMVDETMPRLMFVRGIDQKDNFIVMYENNNLIYRPKIFFKGINDNGQITGEVYLKEIKPIAIGDFILYNNPNNYSL